jgi:Zn-dependent peptidase ImmA (M78 family)
MVSIKTSNNHNMLEWARDEVGYSIEQAAEAIGLSVMRLKAAESGDNPLTLKQLRTVAEKYGIPFGYFYLTKPPYKNSFKPVPDYRIEPGFVGTDHYRLNFEIKKARDQRLVFLELASSLDIPTKTFQLLPKENIITSGKIIRERLNVNDIEISSLRFGQTYSYWKSKIEEDGVLVFESQYLPEQSGVIGVAIYYQECPIILIKRGPSYNSRKLFTLLHEYAHLLKGKSAINDASSQTTVLKNSEIANLEVECHNLAAEILIPSEKVELSDYVNLKITDKMECLAKAFNVTYSTAAVCLWKLNFIGQSELTHLLALRKEANKRKQEKQEEQRKKGEGVKIPREVLMRLDLGSQMFGIVRQAYSSGVLDVFDASRILNLRVNKIDKLVSKIPI